MNCMKSLVAAGFAAAALVAAPVAQAAPFLGETVNYQYYYPNLGSPYPNADNGNYVVGAGVEIGNMVDGVASMDISDTNILIDFRSSSWFNTGSFNGWVLTDVLSSIDAFTSVTIDAITNLAGFGASNVSFDADHIRVNFAGLDFNTDSVVSLTVNGGQKVPEPGALVLMGLGLLAAAGAARMRKRG
ncbi:MAG: hypothetical protein LKCHEGNO_02541 [Burkholderiaceae bacterium]|nr:hypothetical protein [Burkholderiaceae bacterium]